MKKLYFLLMAFCLFTSVNAQIIDIPDANFKARLLAANSSAYIAYNVQGVRIEIDTNHNGEIEKSETLLIDRLDVSDSNISDLSGVNSFSNLRSLMCIGNKLSDLTLTDLPKLTYLNCGENLLNTLNVSGLTNLVELYCDVNQLTSLNISSLTNLFALSMGYNRFVTFDVTGLNKLEVFHCDWNQLTSLNISNMINLGTLTCSNNQFTTLNLLELPGLMELDCSNNRLSTLNVTGSNLTQLNCSNNLFTSLNILGLTNNFVDLDCSYNQLSSLDTTKLSKLNFLNCSYNQLITLDLSSLDILKLLDCSHNLLTSIKLPPIHELGVIVSHNLLESLEVKCFNNEVIGGVVFNDNPNLVSLFLKDASVQSIYDDKYRDDSFFSNCPNLKYVCVKEDHLAGVKSILNANGYSNCEVNSYCSFTPGGVFYTINGNAKLDIDHNGCAENDTAYPNLKFSISNGAATGGIISDASGNYTIPVQAGTHIITPIIENPTYFNVSLSNFQVSFPTETSPYMQNFCITPNGVHNDLEITLIPLDPARPGFDAKYKLVYKNKGNMLESGSVSMSFDDAVLDLVSANPVTSIQTANNLSWDFTNLQPFETREIVFTLNVNSPTETPAVKNDDVLSYTATVTSTDTDETPLDNAFTLNQTVVGSFDPNDKTCLEGSVITPSLIGQYVHYMIRFENKGTYQAQNIVVKDMIDLSKFDISTLVPTSAGHSFVTRISDGNKVEFIFENINLPFDDATNDEYIAFKIKTLPTLAVGDSFENEASIYFDYNFPIVTNKARTTFQTTLAKSDFEFSNYFSLYPNPVKDVLKLSVKNTIEVNAVCVYNALGQMMIAIPKAESVSAIDVANLTSGTYFVKVNTDKGTSNAKFIKN